MSKKPTINDVAREAGVSKATVSYILNGKITKLGLSDTTVSRVLGVCERMGYRPDETAVALSKKRGLALNLLVLSPWLYVQHSDFMSQINAAFKRLMSEYELNLTFAPYESGALQKTLRPAKCKKYDAVLMTGTDTGEDGYLAAHADVYGGRLIALNRRIASPLVSSVYGGDYVAERALAESVRAAGRYSAYVIVGEGFESGCRAERIRALRDALDGCETYETHYTPNDDMRALYRRFPEGSCFFFTMYNSAALFLASVCRDGVEVPYGCGVAGYDIHTLLEPFLPLPLTTVDPGVPAMVRAACEIAQRLKAGEQPESRYIEARLVRGESAVNTLPE